MHLFVLINVGPKRDTILLGLCKMVIEIKPGFLGVLPLRWAAVAIGIGYEVCGSLTFGPTKNIRA
jgi:hypothetical protein